MKRLTFILLISTVFWGTWQVSWGEDYTVRGSGGSGCGDVLSAHDNDETIDTFAYKIWTTGYITGRNYERLSIEEHNISGDSIWYSVIKYCRDNPIHDLANAMEHIYNTFFILE